MAIKIRISDEDFRLVAARFSPEEKANAMDLLLSVLVGETPEVAPISERVGDWWYQISDKLTKERDSYITFCSKAKDYGRKGGQLKNKGKGWIPPTPEEEKAFAEEKKAKEEAVKAKAAKKFVPPTEQECIDYALEVGLPRREGEKFFAHYENVHWRVGRSTKTMSDWKLAMKKTWRNNYIDRGGKLNAPQIPSNPSGSPQDGLEIEKRVIAYLSDEKTFKREFCQQFNPQDLFNLPSSYKDIPEEQQRILFGKVAAYIRNGELSL